MTVYGNTYHNDFYITYMRENRATCPVTECSSIIGVYSNCMLRSREQETEITKLTTTRPCCVPYACVLAWVVQARHLPRPRRKKIYISLPLDRIPITMGVLHSCFSASRCLEQKTVWRWRWDRWAWRCSVWRTPSGRLQDSDQMFNRGVQ